MDPIEKFSNATLTKFLRSMSDSSRFEQLILTDEQGLLIASSGGNQEQTESQAAILSMIKSFMSRMNAQMSLSSTSEFIFRDINGKKLVVRPFFANKTELILSVLIPDDHIPYKRALNSAIRSIQSVWTI
jgi:hypothetical protein